MSIDTLARWHELLESPAAAEGDRRLYDTTIPGYGNDGHTYGDRLTDEERAAAGPCIGF